MPTSPSAKQQLRQEPFHHHHSSSVHPFFLRAQAAVVLLLPLLLLPLATAQYGGCGYAGPFPVQSFALTLTFLNTSASTVPPLFSLFLSTALDYDLQQSSLAPTASTVADLQCIAISPGPPFNASVALPTALVTVAVLGSIATDCGIDPLMTATQLVLDLHAGLVQNATQYPLDPQQNVPVVAVCQDGSEVPVGQASSCPEADGGGGGGGLSEGVVVDIVILVLVALSVVFGLVAWRWLKWREAKMATDSANYN